MKNKAPSPTEQRIALEEIKANTASLSTDALLANPHRRGTSGDILKRKMERASPDDAKHVRVLKKLLDSELPAPEIQKSEAFLHCKRRLTPMQQKYLDGLLAGKFMSAAYRDAYNVGPERTDKSVFNDAWKLAEHPVLVLELKIAAMTKRESKVMNAHQIREFVLTGLVKEASDPTNPSNARIRAMELLGKVAEVGMFITRSEVKYTTSDPEEMKKQLVSKLYDFFRVNRADVDDAKLIEHDQSAVQASQHKENEQTFDAMQRQEPESSPTAASESATSKP